MREVEDKVVQRCYVISKLLFQGKNTSYIVCMFCGATGLQWSRGDVLQTLGDHVVMRPRRLHNRVSDEWTSGLM